MSDLNKVIDSQNEAHDSSDLFEQILAINRRAFALGRYNTAYHTLCAALHWAQDEQNADQIRIVLKLVKDELEWIDRNVPEYKHSTTSAADRGHTSIFSNLKQTASVALQMLERQRKLEDIARIKITS